MTHILSIYSLSLALVSCFNNPICTGRKYQCGHDNTPGVCVNVSDSKSKKYLITSCPLDQECPYDQAAYGLPAKCIQKKAKSLSLPGEFCQNGEQCKSGVCQDYCVGASEDSSCQNHDDCSPSLYCSSNKKCLKQNKMGYQCLNDYECVNNCVCNLGQCTYYYSLAHRQTADNPVACESGRIQNQECAPPLKSVFKGRPCTYDEECQQADTNGQVVSLGQCQCGFNGGGFTYCSLATGDSEFMAMVNALQYVIVSGQYCHTLLRHGPCQSISQQEYSNYWKAYYEYHHYTRLQFNDHCTMSVYNHHYYQLKNSFLLQLSLLAISPLVLLLL